SACRGAVLLDDYGRDAAALFDIDALVPCPGANRRGIQRTGLAAAAGANPARRADLAGVRDVLAECRAQLLAVLATEIDLELSTVEGETDGSFGLSTVDVVDEKGMDLLRHAISPSVLCQLRGG